MTFNNNNPITKPFSIARLALLFILLTPIPAFAATSTLSLDLSSNSILLSDSLTITAKLRIGGVPAPDNALLNQTINLQIVKQANGTTTLNSASTDNTGSVTFANVQLPSGSGTYTISVTYTGDAGNGFAQSASQTEHVVGNIHAGYAVLIEGGIAGGSGEPGHNKSANRMYRTLKARGFTDDRIYYFNQHPQNQPVDISVDNVPTLNNISAAISALKTKASQDPGPIHFILVNHGNHEIFHLNSTELLTPNQLDSWLALLETSAPIKSWPRTLTIAACYSGSFIPAMQAVPGRVLITSGSASEETLKGLMESDGIRSGSYFLDALQQALGQGKNFNQAFSQAATRSRDYARVDDKNFQIANQYQDNSRQHALLEDNQDRQGSHQLSSGAAQDGAQSRQVYLGVGATVQAQPLTTSSSQYQASPGQATLQVSAPPGLDCQRAVLEIRPPGISLPAPSGRNEQLAAPFLTQLMNKTGPDQFSSQVMLDQPGRCELYYHLEGCTGSTTADLTVPMYVGKATNQTAGAFALLKPADNHPFAKTRQLYDWQQAFDLDGDAVTYNLLIAAEAGGVCETEPGTGILIDPVFSRYDIPSSQIYVGAEGGLTDLGTYCWQVQAVDRFGARSLSETFHFKSDDTNFFGGVVGGNMRRAGSTFSIVGAVAAISSRSATSDEGGYYVIEGLPVPIADS